MIKNKTVVKLNNSRSKLKTLQTLRFLLNNGNIYYSIYQNSKAIWPTAILNSHAVF